MLTPTPTKGTQETVENKSKERNFLHIVGPADAQDQKIIIVPTALTKNQATKVMQQFATGKMDPTTNVTSLDN